MCYKIQCRSISWYIIETDILRLYCLFKCLNIFTSFGFRFWCQELTFVKFKVGLYVLKSLFHAPWEPWILHRFFLDRRDRIRLTDLCLGSLEIDHSSHCENQSMKKHLITTPRISTNDLISAHVKRYMYKDCLQRFWKCSRLTAIICTGYLGKQSNIYICSFTGLIVERPGIMFFI